MSKQPLGEVRKTERGFEVIDFSDHYGKSCSLQQSSLAVYEQPGSFALWLGQNENEPPHHVTGIPSSPRMHLNVRQVRSLVRHLRAWLKTGSLELPAEEAQKGAGR